VLLQRVKVQPVSDDIYSSNVTERSQRRRSKLVRRRRRRKNKKTDVKNDRQSWQIRLVSSLLSEIL